MNIESMIRVLVEQKMNKGFQLAQLKKMSSAIKTKEDYKKIINYLTDNFGEPIGKGSSRIVWPISTGKVIKLVLWKGKGPSQAGLEQNKVEVSIWTNPKTKGIVARVYDFEASYLWIISELAKPIAMDGSMNKKIFGQELWPQFLNDFLYEFMLSDRYSSLEEYVQLLIEDMEKNIILLNKKLEKFDEGSAGYYNTENIIKDTKEKIHQLKSINKVPLQTMLHGIKHLIKMNILNSEDLFAPEQFGVTPDGRIIVLDYGASKEVISAYY